MGLLDWLLSPVRQSGKNIFTQITTPPPSSPAAARYSPTPASPASVAPSILASRSQVTTPVTTPVTIASQQKQGAILSQKGISVGIYRAAESVAATIRRGIPIVSQKLQAIPIIGKPLAAVTPYTSESVTRLIETGSMIPGSVETIGRSIIEGKGSALVPVMAAGIAAVPTGFVKSATEEPKQFAADILTTSLLGYGAIKATKAIPLPKYAEVKIPTTLGTSIKPVYETVYRGITFAERPVIGYAPKVGISVGKPSVIGIEPTKILPGYFPQTVLETRVINPRIMKSLGMAPTEIEKLSVGRGLIDITKTQKSAFIRELPAETKTLPKEGVQVVKDVLRENKAQVEKIAGSYAAQAQMMPEHIRVPGDIDLYLKTDQIKAVKMAQSMLKKLKAKGIDAKIDPKSPTRIVTRGEHKEWVHAVELHYIGEVPTIETAMVGSPKIGDIRYGYQVEQAPIMVEGFKAMRLSEQSVRKITGSLEWHPTAIKGEVSPGLKLSPAGHRLKDITDAYFVAKTLIESKKVSPIRRVIEAGKIKKGEALLERWKELYPEAEWKKPAIITEEFIIKGISPAVVRKPFSSMKLPINVSPIGIAIRQQPSIITPSIISPSRISPKLPSVERIYQVPSFYPSVIKPSIRSSIQPSKVPSKIPSRIPSRIPSKVPISVIPSGIPSGKPPSRPPSRPPSTPPSKPPSKVPSYVPPSKTSPSTPSPPPIRKIVPTPNMQRIFKPSDIIKKIGRRKKQPKKTFFGYGEKAAIATATQIIGRK